MKKTIKFYGPFIGAALGLAATVGSMVWEFERGHLSDTRFEVPVVVIDASRGAALEGVKVYGRANDRASFGLTDAQGLSKVTIRSSDRNPGISIRFFKEGYEATDFSLKVDSASSQHAPIQVSMRPLVATPDRYSQTFRSGPVPSGSGRNFSQWYRIVAAPPKPGFEFDLEKSYFTLSGDRQCNAWSECSWAIRTPQSLVFQFRLQGHNEASPPGQAFSEGTLYVEYKRTQ